jgi:23S rRNA (adenine2503-C2)-methyltransferase
MSTPNIDLHSFFESISLNEYKRKIILEWLYSGKAQSWHDMTSISKSTREALSNNVEFSSVHVKSMSQGDSSTKVLFETRDGQYVESVLMKFKDGRNSVCVSSMSGCPVGCTFCATGQMGFNKNLSSKEIVDQVLYFVRKLYKNNERVTNVDFMGMGEPFLNMSNVLNAVSILRNNIGIGARHIVLSTSGYISGIKALTESSLNVRLAVSLHAPTQNQREKIMPIVAHANSLDDLMSALDSYVAKTNKRVTYEYLTLNGVNDSKDDAIELARLLNGRLAHVNLIEFNPVYGINFERSSKNNSSTFVELLKKANIPVTKRVSIGGEIDGACGQLAVRS